MFEVVFSRLGELWDPGVDTSVGAKVLATVEVSVDEIVKVVTEVVKAWFEDRFAMGVTELNEGDSLVGLIVFVVLIVASFGNVFSLSFEIKLVDTTVTSSVALTTGLEDRIVGSPVVV